MKILHHLLATLVFATTALHAAPIINLDFSEGTTGSAPPTNATPVAGAPIQRPTSIYTSGGASLTLAENYTSGSATLAGRSLVMAVNSDPQARQDAQINISAALADFSPNQDYRLTFDLLLNGSVGNLARNSLRLNFYNETFNSTGYQASIILYNNGTQLISGSGNQTFSNSWAADTVLNWEINVLYSTSTLEVKINGVEVGSIALSPAALAGVRGIQFQNGAQNSHFELALGNISAQAIPEPGSIAIVAAGSGLLLLLSRFRRTL